MSRLQLLSLWCLVALCLGALASCMIAERTSPNGTERISTFATKPMNVNFPATTTQPGMSGTLPEQTAASQALAQLEWMPWVGIGLILFGSFFGNIKVYIPWFPADGWTFIVVGMICLVFPSLTATWWFLPACAGLGGFLVWRTWKNRQPSTSSVALSSPAVSSSPS